MDSKLPLVAIACIAVGLVGGYMLLNYTSVNQSAAYQLKIKNMAAAMNATEAQIGVLQAQIQAKDAQIQAKDVVIQSQDAVIMSDKAQIQAMVSKIDSQKALIDAYLAQIDAEDAQIQYLTQLTQLQSDLIKLLEARLASP